MDTEGKKTSLGQAIDTIIGALESLEEGNRKVAIIAALQSLGIQLVQPSIETKVSDQFQSQRVDLSGSIGTDVVDIRTLKNTKTPQSSQEMAALVAYYLQSQAPAADRKDTISTEDLDKYFKQAEYPLPRRIDQVLPDAKAAGYFDAAGRGIYKLNPVGYNLVVHSLPRKAASTAAQARRPPSAPRRNARKKGNKRGSAKTKGA